MKNVWVDLDKSNKVQDHLFAVKFGCINDHPKTSISNEDSSPQTMPDEWFRSRDFAEITKMQNLYPDIRIGTPLAINTYEQPESQICRATPPRAQSTMDQR